MELPAMAMNKRILKEIEGLVGPSNLLTSLEDRVCYSYDASSVKAMPEAVVFPGEANEVAGLMKIANRHRFPVFPRGAGTGMTGGSVPWDGGLVIALTRLDSILEIDEANMLAVVEPGVITARLQEEAEKKGLFYPPDPASLKTCTIGGNVAENAGGPRAVKYGVTRDYVIGLEVVTPTGDIVRIGRRTVKGVVGYELTGLFTGSEGTLGIFTKIILRLRPQPEARRVFTATFEDLDDASRAVVRITRTRIVPSTLEIMDRSAIQAVESHQRIGLPTDIDAMLLIEVDGEVDRIEANAQKLAEICKEQGATNITFAMDKDEEERLWLARRSISTALLQYGPSKINEDITVPVSKVPELIRKSRDLADRYGLIIVNFGHAGDGNIHVNIMADRKDRKKMEQAEKAVEELFRTTLELGGTLSGEHGIGLTKSPYFTWEVGNEGLELMQGIKKALDPLNILNPGKIFIPNRAFYNG